MKLPHRILVLLAASLVILPALGNQAERPTDNKNKEESPAPWRLATDAHAGMQLQAAADYIGDEDWKSAVRLLQHLLDGQPDTVAQLAGRGGKAARLVSVHAEAERLLASMPEAGRQVYQQTYGPRAAALLAEARTGRDAELLARVVERYLYTDAGPAALRELARRFFKNGHLGLAALGYTRLLEHLGPARWAEEDLYQAAAAFHRAGKAALAEQMLKQLRSRGGQDLVRLGKRTLTPEQMRQEIERLAPLPKDPEWPIYRGDAARSNRGAGSPPLLEALWRQSMFHERGERASTAREYIRRAEKKLHEVQEPIIPAFAPVALRMSTARGETESLLIVKNYFGVMAVDQRDGSLAWLSPSEGSLQRLLGGEMGYKLSLIGRWLQDYERQHPQILFENSALGTLSTDGEFVYVVEDLALPPPLPLGRWPRRSARKPSPPKPPPRKHPGDSKEMLLSPFPPIISASLPPGRPELPVHRSSPSEDRKRLTSDPLRIVVAPTPMHGEDRTRLTPDSRPSSEEEQRFLGLPLDRDLAYAVLHNRLYALSLPRSGALSWALGDDEKDPFRDHYFLGAPLPLDGLLYLLVQKEQQVSLVCIDPSGRKGQARQPRIVFQKPLVEVATPLTEDPIRRSRAAPLAYAEGILVCPTNAGVVVGVDLLSRRLAWVYPYPHTDEQVQQLPARVKPNHDLWKATAPVIAEGKVVLAPPDDNSLYCLNLHDGSLCWSRKKRAEDLYLAGVYRGKVLIVGTRSMHALSLARGEILWAQETGVPSGHGIAAGDTYYLPLRRGTTTWQPEILQLDIDSGRVIAHHRTRPRTPNGKDFEVPGNLLFVEGKLISQSPWEVVAYPSLKEKVKEANGRVEQQLDNSASRIERAALLLDAGEQEAAIKDLRAVLQKKLDREHRERARALLFEALSERLGRNLREAQAALPEYQALTAVDHEGLSGKQREEAQAEERRRRQRYHLLAARLRESQGRLADALAEYLDFRGAVESDELIPHPEEAAVRVRAAVAIRGRINELLKKANAEQRKQIEAELERRLKEVRDRKQESRWRDFLELVGPETAAGREGRLLLAEGLLGQAKDWRFLEAELYLLQVSDQAGDRDRAARAVELLARLMTARGLMPDTVYFYRQLRRDFGTIKLPSGKTGAEVWDELATDKRFLPYLDESNAFAARRFRVREEAGDYPQQHHVYPFQHDGEALPFFRRHRFGVDLQSSNVVLQRRLSGEAIWNTRLMRTAFRALLPDANAWPSPRFAYQTQGHLVVLPVDNQIFGLDPVRQRLLWQHDALSEEDRSPSNAVSIQYDPRDGSVRLIHSDGWVHLPGANVVLGSSVVCLATRKGLQGLDPLTGRLLWTRRDLSSGVRLFSDGEHVFVIVEDARGLVASTHVVRLADGGTVRAPDFTALAAQRVQIHGRTLVAARKNDKGGVSLQLYDMLTGKVAWERTFAAKSLVMRSIDSRFAGVVEPDGKIHVVDTALGKEVMSGQMTDPDAQLRKVDRIYLLTDDRSFYLASSAPIDETPTRREKDMAAWSDLAWNGVPVNRGLHVFSREKGEFLWYVPLKRQQWLVLEQFRELPVIFVTSSVDQLDLRPGDPRERVTTATLLQKTSGTAVYDNRIKNGKPFYAVRGDPESGTIIYLSPTLKLICRPREEPRRK